MLRPISRQSTLSKSLACIISATLILALTPSMPREAIADDEPRLSATQTVTQLAVESYSYEATPVISPDNAYLCVKTDSPDPESFRLVDKSSVYTQNEVAFQASTRTFRDVAYSDTTARRTNGGYIFVCSSTTSDGGTLVVQERSGSTWVDTSATASCPVLQDRIDYLLDTYASDADGLWAKLDAIQPVLRDELAVYPCPISDASKPKTGIRHPFWNVDTRPDVTWYVPYVAIYQNDADGSLLYNAYPYILDSSSFPNLMYAIAKRIEPGCIGKIASYDHSTVQITYGQTQEYGGQGTGGRNPIFSHRLEKDLSFDGGASDYAAKGIAAWRERLLEYKKQADVDNAELHAQLETIQDTTTGGSWISVNPSGNFAYVASHEPDDLLQPYSDTWIDGRYINASRRIERAAKLEEHMDASVILRGVDCVDSEGNAYVSDVRFWPSGGTWLTRDDESTVSELSFDELKAMVDANGNRPPETGLVYDGSQPCGTPFTTIFVQGVSMPATCELYAGEDKPVETTIEPADATYRDLTWETSDSSVASVSYDGKTLYGYKPGTAIITGTTLDGGYTVQCTVTVKEKPVESQAEPNKPTDNGAANPTANPNANPTGNSTGSKTTVNDTTSTNSKNQAPETTADKPTKRNPMKAKTTTKKVKRKQLRKKARTVRPITVKNAQGATSFTTINWSKKVKKHIKLDTRNGTIKVKKKTPKGTCKFKVKVVAAGNETFEPASKDVKVTIRVI